MTIGVIVSLVLISLGYPEADPVAGIVVGLVVARTGFMIIRESTETLVDRSYADISAIEKIVLSVPGVKGCHDVRTRGAGNHVFVDIHVLVDPKMTVEEAHAISDSIEGALTMDISEIADVVVHIEPFDNAEGPQDKI